MSRAPPSLADKVLQQLDAQVLLVKVNHTYSLPYYYKKLDDLIQQSLVYESEGDIERAYTQYRRSCYFFLHTVAEHRQFNRTNEYERNKFTRLTTECMSRMQLMRNTIVAKYDEVQQQQQQRTSPATTPRAVANVHANGTAQQQPAQPQPQVPAAVSAPSQANAQSSQAPSSAAPAAHTADSTQTPASAKAELNTAMLSRLSALGITAAGNADSDDESKPPSLQRIATHSRELSKDVLDDASKSRLSRLGIQPLTDTAPDEDEHQYNKRLAALGVDEIPPTDSQDAQARLAALGITGIADDQQQQHEKPEATSNTLAPPYIPIVDDEPASPAPLAPSPSPAPSAAVAAPNVPISYPSLAQQQQAPRTAAGQQQPAGAAATRQSSYKLPAVTNYRAVHVPFSLLQAFDQYASSNTKQNQETCGVLCGKLVRNELYVTHVILPKQIGSANQCNTMDEEHLYMVQSQRDLLTLGWIHTHPTQTAFLSSIDLHTQYGYQIMLAEAVAIVLSPTADPNYGAFTISPDGMKMIQQCTYGATFHSHDRDTGLFEQAKHLTFNMDPRAKVQFIDLR